MSQDVVINGTTYPGVEYVALVDESGNEIRFFDEARIDGVVDEQTELIQQIKTALKGKTAGGGSGDPDLPAGYRRVDFIQFNNAQIVDTGVICNQDTTIKVLYTREVSTAMYMYGVTSTGNTESVTAYLSSGGAWRFGAKSTSRTITVSDDIIHTAVVSKTGIISDGGDVTFSGTASFETIGTLTIGACRNANGSVADAQYIGKIFVFEMWDGTEQILKLIPVTNGTAFRFWDTVSKAFFDSITDSALEGGNV